MDLKIIHVVLGKANPNRMNGVNKVVDSLAKAQVSIGHDASVWGITKNPVHDYPDRIYSTELFFDPTKYRLDPAIKQRLLELDPATTIFHIHGAFIPQFYAFAKLLVKLNFRYNYTPHGAFNTVALQRSAFKKRIYISLRERFLVKHANRLHLIGESEVTGTKKVFKQFDYALIQNGQDMSPITAPFSNNRKSVPVFGFVGRLDAHTKGLDLLIQAFAEWVEKTGAVAELRLLGDGPDKIALEQMAQGLGIASMVKMLGPKYGEEKIAEMKQFDFLCLNSRNEGLPGVVLEAAELGIPALVSKETNMGTFIQRYKAGLVSASNTIEGILEMLEKATSATEEPLHYRQMSNNAIQMIKQEFDWKMIAQKHIESYA